MLVHDFVSMFNVHERFEDKFPSKNVTLHW